MSVSGIARYLKDFDAPEPEVPMTPAVTEVTSMPPEAAPLDLEAERAAAHEQGRRSALAEAEVRLEEELRLQDERRHHALAALTQRYEGEIATTIASSFETLAVKLGMEIGAQVADVLAPLLEQAVIERMIDRFAATLSEAIAKGGVVTVGGPRTLFDRLAASPVLAGTDLKHVEKDDVDISIEIGSTLVTTRLAAWQAELRETLP